MDINKARLEEEFINLVKISSESRSEKSVAGYIAEAFKGITDEIIFDTSLEKTKSDTNNLIIKIRGADKKAPCVLLCSHLDTVVPGKEIKPIKDGGTIKSDGTTILGSDCKSGIAIILEVIRSLKEHKVYHGDIELLFTVCEEIGLLGAKNLDYSIIESKICFVLDTCGAMRVINKAPSANKIKFTIYGKEAHAGLEPEKGISAIKIAARAVELMKIGRIDFETTANIGKIHGGIATNIVPNFVTLEGEARSHDPEKLKKQTDNMREAIAQAVIKYKKGESGKELPYFEEDISLEYERFDIDEGEYLIRLCKKAADKMGKEVKVIAAGGGSDANIFNAHGIVSVIVSTGMDKVHTLNECIDIYDMHQNASFLLNILTLNSGSY